MEVRDSIITRRSTSAATTSWLQHMRVLAPLLEASGVDFVLSGPTSTNYQRPRPIKFVPVGYRACPPTSLAGPDAFRGPSPSIGQFDGVRQTARTASLRGDGRPAASNLYDAGWTVTRRCGCIRRTASRLRR